MRKRAPDFNRLLGARLRAARIEHSLTQQQIGERLGVSFQQVQKYENGKNNVSAATLLEFARHYERPLEWFLASVALPAAGGIEPDLGTRALATATGRELLQAFLAIENHDARAALVRTAQAIADASKRNLQAAE